MSKAENRSMSNRQIEALINKGYSLYNACTYLGKPITRISFKIEKDNIDDIVEDMHIRKTDLIERDKVKDGHYVTITLANVDEDNVGIIEERIKKSLLEHKVHAYLLKPETIYRPEEPDENLYLDDYAGNV